jgi:nucleoside-diphosphate-sugar epimerase
LDDRISRPTDSVVEAIGHCPGEFAVLGAGGKLGFHVSRMLQRALARCGRDDRISVVSRFAAPERQRLFRESGFHVVAADLSDPDQVDRLPHADHVVFLAGIKFGTDSSPELLERMNVRLPTLVANHYRSARIVALSTGCVYSFVPVGSAGSTEQSETDPPGDYAQSCLGREHAFREGSRRHGTPCVLVRLNYAIDLRYGVLVDIAERILAADPVPLDTGYVNLIWQGDAVAQILRCLTLAQSPPLVINVTGCRVLSVRDLAMRMAAELGRPVTFCGCESPTAWLSDSSLAASRFGRPLVSVEQMIAWTAQWLKNDGPTLGKPTHFENRDGRY